MSRRLFYTTVYLGTHKVFNPMPCQCSWFVLLTNLVRSLTSTPLLAIYRAQLLDPEVHVSRKPGSTDFGSPLYQVQSGEIWIPPRPSL